MSYITAIGTAVPEHRFDQATICAFMERMMKLDDGARRKLRAVFRASGIDYRHSVLADYGRTSDFEFYPNDASGNFPTTEARMQAFRRYALPLSVRAVEDMTSQVAGFEMSSVTHLIVVCCTGMYAPGVDIELVRALKLKTTIERTSITFMGCYAAFNALKAANAFCSSDSNSKVLIVCTELCSLHFQNSMSEDNLLANALFADGSAAVLVEATTDAKKRFKLTAFHSDLELAGEHDMAWSIGDLGFEMKLTSYIPSIIRGGIGDLTQALLSKIKTPLENIRHFAFHPGGIKILEAIEQALRLGTGKNELAYKVLRNNGNMSSPTVLFVLREIFQITKPEDDQDTILSLAFGPGLTLESMVLKIEA
jgi:prepilin-type processing-associated H-X9-DG protein